VLLDPRPRSDRASERSLIALDTETASGSDQISQSNFVTIAPTLVASPPASSMGLRAHASSRVAARHPARFSAPRGTKKAYVRCGSASGWNDRPHLARLALECRTRVSIGSELVVRLNGQQLARHIARGYGSSKPNARTFVHVLFESPGPGSQSHRLDPRTLDPPPTDRSRLRSTGTCQSQPMWDAPDRRMREDTRAWTVETARREIRAVHRVPRARPCD